MSNFVPELMCMTAAYSECLGLECNKSHQENHSRGSWEGLEGRKKGCDLYFKSKCILKRKNKRKKESRKGRKQAGSFKRPMGKGGLLL